MIYFDANANFPLSQAAISAMSSLLESHGNPASVHGIGRHLRHKIDDARQSIKKSLGASSARLIFTSGGSEANNLALKGTQSNALITTPVEHASVRNVSHSNKILTPVKTDGLVDLDALDKCLQEAPKNSLVSIGWANSETGVIQPIQEIAHLVHEHGGLLHTDAVQVAGKAPLSFDESGVDMMSISAHKCGGPVGCGALILKESIHINAQIEGGGHEYGMRSGTLASHQIVGFSVGLEDSIHALDSWKNVAQLRDELEAALHQAGGHIIAQSSPRLPNTSCIVMPGVDASLQVMSFDLAGFAVSAGSACSSGKVKTSPVLESMQLPDVWAKCAIRVSLSPHNTPDEIGSFIREWKRLIDKQYVA